MARTISAENLAALKARALVARDFLTVLARNRSDNSEQEFGFWSGLGTVQASVIDPDSGAPETRTFVGAGALIAISDIPLVANLTVQTVTIEVSQIDDTVNAAFRTYDLRQARVEIFRGLFSPESQQMVAAAECRFVGFVDTVQVRTPAEGEPGAVTFTCASHTREMTRSNPDTRSDASQRRRNPTDNFYQDTATVGEWELFWGRTNGKLAAQRFRQFFQGR